MHSSNIFSVLLIMIYYPTIFKSLNILSFSASLIVSLILLKTELAISISLE